MNAHIQLESSDIERRIRMWLDVLAACTPIDPENLPAWMYEALGRLITEDDSSQRAWAVVWYHADHQIYIAGTDYFTNADMKILVHVTGSNVRFLQTDVLAEALANTIHDLT